VNLLSKLIILFAALATLAGACRKRGDVSCLSPKPPSFDFIVFDPTGKNSADGAPRTFNLVRSDTRTGIDIGYASGQRSVSYWTSSELVSISLEGVKTFYFFHGGSLGDKFIDTLYVDAIPGENCAPPGFRAVRLNGKAGTFEYGIGPNGAFVFRK
jgi:hypothetical protein